MVGFALNCLLHRRKTIPQTAEPAFMTDEQLQSSWPDLGAVVIELRRLAHTALADRLIDCDI